MTGVLADVVVGGLTMSFRSSAIGRRGTYGLATRLVTGDVHTVWDIDPDDSINMNFFVAFE